MKTSITTIKSKFKQLLLFIIFIFVSGVASGQDMISTPTQISIVDDTASVFFKYKGKLTPNVQSLNQQIKAKGNAQLSSAVAKYLGLLDDLLSKFKLYKLTPLVGLTQYELREKLSQGEAFSDIVLKLKELQELAKQIAELGGPSVCELLYQVASEKIIQSLSSIREEITKRDYNIKNEYDLNNLKDFFRLRAKLEYNNSKIEFFRSEIKKYQAEIEKLKAILKDGFIIVPGSYYYDPLVGLSKSSDYKRPIDEDDIYNIQKKIESLEKEIKEAEKKIRELEFENSVLGPKVDLLRKQYAATYDAFFENLKRVVSGLFLGTPNCIIGSNGSLSPAPSDGPLQYVSVSIPDSLVFENTSGPEDSLSSASTTEEDNLDLLVFPQPAEQGALIQLSWPVQEEEFHLVILDPYGTTIETKDFPVGDSNFTLDTHQWLSGFYHLLMYSETETVTRKILIE